MLSPGPTTTLSPPGALAARCNTSQTVSPSPSQVEGLAFSFDEGVPDAERIDTITGTRLAQAYVTSRLGAVDSEVQVHVRIDSERNGSAVSGYPIIIYTGGEGFRSAACWSLVKIAAHEYIHLWQRKHPGSPRVPNWLHEGAPEYIAYQIVQDAGVVTHAEARALILRIMPKDLPPLANFEIRPSGPRQSIQINYSLAFFAVERLLHGRDVEVLREFYRLTDRMGWEQAFESVFGLSVSDYYSVFERYRQNGFR